jgi:hypothetical protein
MVSRSLKCLSVLVVLGAVAAAADDRLAVLEFFGRQGCSICRSAGPALTTLQHEMEGRTVLLEYDYDAFLFGRQDRFWASGASATYLPLVMVGSGYRTTSGPVDFEPVFRSMINDELARPVRAAVSAFWRRNGNTVRAYVNVQNLGHTMLEIDHEAGIWLIAYENSTIGHSTTWVRSTAFRYLPFDLPPEESVSDVIDSTSMGGVDWDRMTALVVIEDRPGGAGAYDMLQATQAFPADLAVSPDALEMDRRGPGAEVTLTGPHVLSWSATADVPWIEVSPTTGELPATVTLNLRPELQPQFDNDGLVTFSASGDDMEFEISVDVSVSGFRRRTNFRRSAPLR